MGIVEILLISLGLSADAFAVSVCQGINTKEKLLKTAFIRGIFFGVFQSVMPIIGYLIGSTVTGYLSNYSSFIAFALLTSLGIKSIQDTFKVNDCCCKQAKTYSSVLIELLMASIATSIDALVIGITFSMFNSTQIVSYVIIIGVVTFFVCFIGVLIGNKIGSKYNKKASLFGGVVLLLIGLRFLLF